MTRNPRTGLEQVSARMAEDPGYYARWYLLRKPWLLWDWNIRIGWGDVYFQRVRHSPLDVNPPLRWIKLGLHWLNPVIFALAVWAAIMTFWRHFKRPLVESSGATATLLVALFCVYVTVIHTVFQAEPRYSIPYRPFELLLTCTALAAILAWYRRWRSPA